MPISLAVPRGRLFEPVLELFAATGVPLVPEDQERRELVIERDGWRFLMARPRDVSLFVEHGLADFGVAGKEALLETPRDVVESLDLGIGRCRLALARPDGEPTELRRIRRIATKYPRLTEEYAARTGLTAQVLVMHGAVESAATLGLADAIVDLVETGSTLRANGLVVVDILVESSARLIANPVAYRLRSREVRAWTERLRQQVDQMRAALELAQERQAVDGG